MVASSKELKSLTKAYTAQIEINDNLPDEDMVEIFDVQTERDLENLRRFLYLKARNNGASECSLHVCCTSSDRTRH